MVAGSVGRLTSFFKTAEGCHFLFGCTVKKKQLVRAYKLKLYGNVIKVDTARYTSSRFSFYINMFAGRLFFDERIFSTKNMGGLANKAQYKALGIIRAQKESSKALGNKKNVPVVKNCGCPAIIRKSKTKHFDYWVRISNQFYSGKGVCLPAKSHKALNMAIKQGWEMSKTCEFKMINGNAYAIAFVKKDKPKINRDTEKMIGIDVGIKHSITTSEGHYGYGLRPVIKKQKQRQAERRRQHHKVSSKMKSEIKQLLDKEAKALIRRSCKAYASLAVESPKRLANLRSGKLQGWARCYLANRLHILGLENGVLVLDINPYQTSQTCSECGNVDKLNRVNRDEFRCLKCGHKAHADYNASVVISQKGTQILNKIRK